ncbi:helix-turn-helix domain-containing protein [Paenibacillus sp. tmac-D7]|uniref:helix-turn-helix domain-containing protein n=1 Tax=Paenibacillus sp. tmac-D7 TaxID=2591462 RepID=UPI001144DFFF|nr:helix-turn-helix domain-containing protein [Paenibacillus sp. tmac-D7]
MNDLMRYKMLAEALVPPAAKLLYSYLMDRAGGRHGSVVLSGQKLALEVGLSPSTVRRNLHRLQHIGLIRIMARYSEEGIRLANQITFL